MSSATRMGNSVRGLEDMTSILLFVIPFGAHEVKKKSQRRIYVCTCIINDVTSIFIPGGILSQETFLVIQGLRASLTFLKIIWFTSMAVN